MSALIRLRYKVKEAIRKIGVRYLWWKVSWYSGLAYPPHEDGKCPCGASEYKCGNWNWKGHHVKYCPECAAHLSTSVQLMVRMDDHDPVFGTVADLDNGQETLHLTQALLKMGCKPYFRPEGIGGTQPGFFIPLYDWDWAEGYTIHPHETWLNYLRRIHRFAKEVAPHD